MALVTITQRHGTYDDMEKSKYRPAEFGIVLSGDPTVPSGKSVYVGYGGGDVRRLVSIEDLEEMIERGDLTGKKGDTGVSVKNVDINESGHLIVYLDNGKEVDAGYIDDALAKIEEATRAAGEAKDSAAAAKTSEGNASDSATAALQAEQNADKSASDASTSATAAAGSESKAKEYKESAEASATKADESADAAKTSENASKSAQTAAETAKTGAEMARTEAETAREGAETARTGAEAAKAGADASKIAAATSASESENWRKWSESYAHGNTGVRVGEDTDNAEYWYQQAKRISQGKSGIVNMGNVKFAQLDTIDKQANYMYNVEDAFTSNETFNDGGGKYYGAGSNVVWTGDDKWDVLAPVSVGGVKGDNETYFRQGNVTLTKDNIGLSKVNNTADSEKNVASAGKLTTAREIAVSGDAVGKTTFNGEKNVAIDVHRRGCVAGQSTNKAGTNTWYKFAELKNTGANTDYEIAFLVQNGKDNDASSIMGILVAHVRTGADNQVTASATYLKWIVATNPTDAAKFCLMYSPATPTAGTELWVNCDTSWVTYRFDVLGEGRRNDRTHSYWTLIDSYAASGSSAPTSSYTRKNSVFAPIHNQAASDSSKVAKAGDTMTGDLTMSGAVRAIKYNSGTRNGSPIQFFQGNVNGSGIVIGDGGRVIIGAGESGNSLHTALGTGTANEGKEEMHIASDGTVYIHSNGNSIDARKTSTFDGSGNLSIPGVYKGKANDVTVDYTTADVEDTDASVWTKIAKITSGMSLANLFNRMSTMFKNVRYLYKMLGTTDISKIGGGTVTGALSELNGKAITSGIDFGVCTNTWAYRFGKLAIIGATSLSNESTQTPVTITDEALRPAANTPGIVYLNASEDRNKIGRGLLSTTGAFSTMIVNMSGTLVSAKNGFMFVCTWVIK